MSVWIQSHWYLIATVAVYVALPLLGRAFAAAGFPRVAAAFESIGLDLKKLFTRAPVLALLLFLGCSPSTPAAQTIAGAECVSHRTALELACVDMYANKDQIDACRADVKAKDDCTKDAGGDR